MGNENQSEIEVSVCKNLFVIKNGNNVSVENIEFYNIVESKSPSILLLMKQKSKED